MAYSKLHSSVVNSSLWCAPDPVRLLFITFLAICDADGCVYGSRGGIARQANIKYPQHPDPFDALMSPDMDSSDLKLHPENEGRRIIEIEGGFQIINYAFYRALRNSDDRKVQNREAQKRFRERHKPQSAKVSHGKPRSAHAEAEAEAEAKKKEGANGSRPPVSVEDWLKELEADPTYKGVNVRIEYGKMLNWCKVRKKQPTQRRFINWLNNAERTLPANHAAKVTYKRNYTPPPEPQLSDDEREELREQARQETEALRLKLRTA